MTDDINYTDYAEDEDEKLYKPYSEDLEKVIWKHIKATYRFSMLANSLGVLSLLFGVIPYLFFRDSLFYLVIFLSFSMCSLTYSMWISSHGRRLFDDFKPKLHKKLGTMKKDINIIQKDIQDIKNKDRDVRRISRDVLRSIRNEDFQEGETNGETNDSINNKKRKDSHSKRTKR